MDAVRALWAPQDRPSSVGRSSRSFSVADDRTERVANARWGQGMSAALTWRSYRERHGAPKGCAVEGCVPQKTHIFHVNHKTSQKRRPYIHYVDAASLGSLSYLYGKKHIPIFRLTFIGHWYLRTGMCGMSLYRIMGDKMLNQMRIQK